MRLRAGCSGLKMCVFLVLDESMGGFLNIYIHVLYFPLLYPGKVDVSSTSCRLPLSSLTLTFLRVTHLISGYKKNFSMSPCTVETCFKDLAQGPKSCCRCHHHHESLVELLYNISRDQLRQDPPEM